MKTTFIGHSCYILETEPAYLIFDCMAFPEEQKAFGMGCAGELPEMDPEKELIVFVSHSHKDHYSPGIWTLRERFRNVRYVISRDVEITPEVREEAKLTAEDEERILVVKAKKSYELILESKDVLQIEALASNDVGVAYFLTLNGVTIFHAGDLHYWVWDDQPDSINDYLVKIFKKQLDILRGRHVDIAYLLIDNRMPDNLFTGMDMYLEAMDVRYVFPIHFWERYDLVREYRELSKDKPYADAIMCVERNGQSFEIEIS